MIPKVNQRDGLTEKFARYEFKYLLNAVQRECIEGEVSHFMKYDGFVHSEMENSYIVRSLYFDNDQASHFRDKTEGIRHRRKFRIRTYGREYDPDTPIYLEEKGRHIDRTFKSRVRLEKAEMEDILRGDDIRLLTGPDEEKDLFSKLAFDRWRKNVKAMVLVDYVRRPYTSNFDLNFRVTFDSELTASGSPSLFPGGDVRWRRAVAGYTVLEVKFHRRIPAWFQRIIKTHNLRRLSISKFCKGMEVCGLAKDLS